MNNKNINKNQEFKRNQQKTNQPNKQKHAHAQKWPQFAFSTKYTKVH